MNKTSLKMTVLLFVGIGVSVGSVNASASGCAWTPEYAKGRLVSTAEVHGHVQCTSPDGSQGWYCLFHSDDGLTPVMTSGWQKTIGDQDLPVVATVEKWEAMAWENCDGGDPVPDYKTNGTYYTGMIGGVLFDRFESLPASAP